jgi:DNA-binding response OmpR family regulator
MKESGFDGTVSKPFKIPDIMARMKQLLQDEAVVKH